MTCPNLQIERVGLTDLLTVTRMAHANMSGVDRYFTELVSNPLSRRASYLYLPLYFLLAGRGYKADVAGEVAGCAFLHLREQSGFVFNVNVNHSYRRQGIGTRLMLHLERVTRDSGRGWTVLQVDGDNVPARELYVHLGYRSYHPHLMRHPGLELPEDLTPSRATISPLLQRDGRERYRRYRRIELQSGDSWAADVMREYGHELNGGRYWSLTAFGKEVGCAWSGTVKGQATIRLNLLPQMWGDPGLAEYVRQMAAQYHGPDDHLHVYLGSSAHHEAAAPLLHRLGFDSQEQIPLLMVKQL